MIRIYIEKTNQFEKKDISNGDNVEIEKGSWIEVTSPTVGEIEWLKSKIRVPAEFITSAIDEEESAHIDTEDGAKLIVLDVPRFDPAKDSIKA